jgi:hypothetical protein
MRGMHPLDVAIYGPLKYVLNCKFALSKNHVGRRFSELIRV